MISNYLIYFFNLLPSQQIEQLSIILIFFYSLIAFCFLLVFLKFRFFDETRESWFQRFLKNI